MKTSSPVQTNLSFCCAKCFGRCHAINGTTKYEIQSLFLSAFHHIYGALSYERAEGSLHFFGAKNIQRDWRKHSSHFHIGVPSLLWRSNKLWADGDESFLFWPNRYNSKGKLIVIVIASYHPYVYSSKLRADGDESFLFWPKRYNSKGKLIVIVISISSPLRI